MQFPYLPEVSLTEFSKRLHKHVMEKRIPTGGSFELTFRCNLRCVHCYCNLALNDQDAVKEELNTQEIRNILDQIAEAGCLWLLMSGGEPLVRKDFLEIYTYAKKKGFIITLFTNGTLITPELADYLVQWPPSSVEITLYGITSEVFERVTGVPGSFKRCKNGIELLLERKIPLELKTMVMTLNKEELWQIKRYSEELGLDFRFDPELNARLDGSKTPCNFRLSPQEVVELDLADRKRAKKWKEFCEKFVEPVESDNLYSCGAGINTFHVNPYGKLTVCSMSRFQEYNLRSGSFKEGWEKVIPEFLTLKAKTDYPCGKCDLISLCNQCPGWAWLENGNPEEPVEYFCQIAHLRAEAFRKNKNLERKE
jgi:radical SAM protein with 4Fe4S-binding SPASM domain